MQEIESLLRPMDQSRIGAKVKADTTLSHAFIKACEAYGLKSQIAKDVTTSSCTYGDLMLRIRVLARLIKKAIPEVNAPVGLMLPTSSAMVASFFALQFLGRTAGMINFTQGVATIVNSCRTARIEYLVTSHAFVEKAGLLLVLEALLDSGLHVLYLEDMRAGMTLYDKGFALIAKYFPQILRLPKSKITDTAVILFTSGSEGEPKGVALSHQNILSNIAQFTAHIDVGSWDRLFSCLPLYHSFGLTVGALLPMLTGMETMFYPSPLHYHDVPRLIRENQSTLLLTTDTFLTGYARMGVVEDFASLRYIVAGAEKLKDKTRQVWAQHFGKVILEGYGVTETSPVLSVNTPAAFSVGSVGKLLPDIDVSLRPVDGIKDGAELWVRGPNIMKGYLTSDAKGVLQPPKDGWHNTGDVVSIDDKGFLTIKGRIKRFAKIGGEMISLVAIEQTVSQLHPGTLHAVISIPHDKRGESIVLLTEEPDIDMNVLRQALREAGHPDLALPRQVLAATKVPVMGSGKIDYVSARRYALTTLQWGQENRVQIA